MYTEYIKQWKHYHTVYGDQTALFIMVGKFYELYDILDTTGEGQTNVKQAVETLGITLTTRKADGPKGEDTYFAGFPEQSLQKFAGLLTREGWTVVVCDQEKNDKGKVQGRPVARIFSPGTHIETAGAEAPYLAGIWMEELEGGNAPRFAAAVLDLTTGHITSYQGQAQGGAEVWSADDLVHFFQVHQPREIVFWWRGAMLTRPQEAMIRRRCGLIKGAIHLELANETQQGALENPLVRRGFLERKFAKHLSLLPVQQQLFLVEKSRVERVLVALLRFAEDHIPSATENIQQHSIWAPESSIYLGNNTLLQLNYIGFSQEQSVLSLFNKTMTSLGRRGMRDRLLFPSADSDVIRKRLHEVRVFYDMPMETRKSIESQLRMIHDIARLHRKIVMFSIDATDILALDQSYGCIQNIQTILAKVPQIAMNAAEISSYETYRAKFLAHFNIEKARLATGNQDITFLPSSKAPKTIKMEEEIENIRRTAMGWMEKIRLWASLPEGSLKLETNESQSFFITGTKTILTQISRKLSVSDMSTHPFQLMRVDLKKSVKSSLTFPELEKLHFVVLGLRSKLNAAFTEELRSICSEVNDPIWTFLEKWISNVDVTLTLAKVALDRGYKEPIIYDVPASSNAGVQAKELRHPLLEAIQTRTEYVRHSVSIGFNESDDSGWLLYGMNASGKSSLMKAIGISILLAQAGSYVPASEFHLKPFKSILTRILNQDNLWAGMSSFAVEVAELRDIFQRASVDTSQSLVLGDELCSGTESISATSLVAAGIHYLHTVGSRFVFATHLHGLNQISDIRSLKNLGTWHLKVHYEPISDKLVYDRTLHKGPGGTLYGLEVARAMHIPHEILKMATAYRKQILGEVSEEEMKASSWNATVFRKDCEICKNPIVRELEVHHITPRADANKATKQFQNGSAMNDLRNLIVVCQECHDKHHDGCLEIGVQKDTSEGPQREILIRKKVVKTKWTEEQTAIMESYLRKYPNLPLARIVYDLGQQEDIKTTEASLRKMRLALDS